MAEVYLYDSTVCRLCASKNENGNGEMLFVDKDDNSDLSSMVNRYLPLKVQDDGKLPRTICSACNIQLEVTVQFFDLLISGQQKIREMYKQQVEEQKRVAKIMSQVDKSILEETANISDLEHIDDNISNENTTIIYKIMQDGTMYMAEHEMSLQMEGLEKPRRKRGRPPKTDKIDTDGEKEKVEIKEQTFDSVSQEEDEEEFDGDSRRRRRRKAPKRFKEAVQGKEMERMFKEEGVIDEEDVEIGMNMVTESGAKIEFVVPDSNEEVIGHLAMEDGTSLNELVTINKLRGRGRPKLRRRKNKYTCTICNKGFSQRSRYVMHKNFHKDEKFECAECKKQYNSKDNLVLHQKTTGHTGETTKEFEDIDEKKDLEESENLKNVEEVDNSEKLKLSDNAELPKEIETEKVAGKSDKYPCDVCGKVLNHPSSVIYHKEAEHNNGRRFVCNKCDKSFKHKQLLQRHQLVHSEFRPYACKSCKASFKTKANLINHQSTHTGEKKYCCEICSQQFAHKTSLTLHYRWHTGQKPFTCEVCQKSFSQNGNLQEHMRIHTGEKPYACDDCGRSFTTSSQYKLHQKRHTGERPWKCDFCPKSFLHKDTWKCHVRRHKGERPFKCPQCPRCFTEQWALKKHIRLHTGEKPYSCDICQKKFADCSNLTKHKKVHRENKITINESEDQGISEVWHILPHDNEGDESSLGERMVVEDDASEDGGSQIIYLYQDSEDPLQSRTLQLVDADADIEKSMSIEVADENAEKEAEDEAYEDEEEEINEPQYHLQVIDETGNQLPLTQEEAQQFLSNKNIIHHLNDGQSIRIHPDLLPNTRTNQNLSIINLSKVEEAAEKPDLSTVQTSADDLVKELQDGSNDSTSMAVISPLESGSRTLNVLDNSHPYEFTTQDGQKYCLVTSFQGDTIQLDPIQLSRIM